MQKWSRISTIECIQQGDRSKGRKVFVGGGRFRLGFWSLVCIARVVAELGPGRGMVGKGWVEKGRDGEMSAYLVPRGLDDVDLSEPLISQLTTRIKIKKYYKN